MCGTCSKIIRMHKTGKYNYAALGSTHVSLAWGFEDDDFAVNKKTNGLLFI